MTDKRPDLEVVFDHYGKRILHGGEWQKAECPLLAHEDRNPSASVNLDAGKWSCFSCGAKGDVYDIIKENEGLAGFSEARRWAEEHLAAGSRAVRSQRRPSGGLSVRPPSRQGRRNWSPPWSGI